MRALTRENIRQLQSQLLDPFGGDICLTPVGYDIRVGEKIYFLSSGKEIKLKKGKSVEIPPRERFALESLEKIKMKENMFALIATRIRLLWEGLTSLGTKIDPMFQDKLTLIFSNDSDTPLTLEYGQRICNVIFFEYENPPKDIEIRTRPSFVTPPPLERIEEPVRIEEIKRKYGLGIASIIQYVRPRLRSHENRLRGLERFKTGITTVMIGAFSTFVVSLIIWVVTQ